MVKPLCERMPQTAAEPGSEISSLLMPCRLREAVASSMASAMPSSLRQISGGMVLAIVSIISWVALKGYVPYLWRE